MQKNKFLDIEEIIQQLISILDCYEGKIPLISNQGQAMDGYSALANFLNLAREVKLQTLKENEERKKE
jgi:hypothetical protein